ncbi:prunin 1 Pru du 6.0101-like [Pyrus communis]|uniref:prunin 1 Pru du 6.0101-like n=1 Tax=Pyrus communis TaxID=23211 RepID=UPI0035C06B76
MAKLFVFSLCLLLIINSSLGSHQQFQQQNECQFDQLQSREPDNQIQSEAGLTESWNPNDQQFQCAGVAMVRRTIQPNGLHLPSFLNSPQLIYIVQGRGVLGVAFPGCPETFEDSQDQQFQHQQQFQPFQPSRRHGGQGQQQQQSEDNQDRHQKVRHIREGDIIALPAGVAYWSYNNGNQDLVAISLLDFSNEQNQLDQQPRRFYLAGNPQDEFSQQQGQRYQQGRQQQQQGRQQQQQGRQQQQQGQGGQQERGQQGRRGQQQQGGNSKNLFAGFDTQMLAQALNVDEEIVNRLQGLNDDRNEIVQVQGQLDFVGPFSQGEQEGRRQMGGGGRDNSLEETFCSMRLKENIRDPSRADFYSPQAGRVSVVNSGTLPILSALRLSAEHGVLYNNAIYSPYWNLNANELVYVIRGNARVQVVNENGDAILDDEVNEGQVFLIPQNHAVITQAGNQGFEYISFRTNDLALINTMAGRTAVLRAIPEDVLRNAFQIDRQQVRDLKNNRQETRVLSASSSSSRRPWSIMP